MESPLLGALAAGLSILLSVSLLAAVVSFVTDAIRGTRRAFGEQKLPQGRSEEMQQEVSDLSKGAA